MEILWNKKNVILVSTSNFGDHFLISYRLAHYSSLDGCPDCLVCLELVVIQIHPIAITIHRVVTTAVNFSSRVAAKNRRTRQR